VILVIAVVLSECSAASKFATRPAEIVSVS
jgi:hypothetical protein